MSSRLKPKPTETKTFETSGLDMKEKIVSYYFAATLSTLVYLHMALHEETTAKIHFSFQRLRIELFKIFQRLFQLQVIMNVCNIIVSDF